MASLEPDPLEVFGRRVRARRHKLKWTQEDLAEQSALHVTYISGIERGVRNIGLNNVVNIAAALEIDPAKLVKGLLSRLAP